MATFTIGSRTRTSAPQTTQINVKEENDGERKPTEEKDEFWIMEHPRDDNISAGGKWMLFYPNSTIDIAWVKAKRLFRDGSLSGISCMKVSTARSNPGSTSKSTKVIIFCCGPPHDEVNIMSYGHNLIDMMEYRSRNPYVYYKSDAQTQQGTRTTGQTKNHLYRINVLKGPVGVETKFQENGKRVAERFNAGMRERTRDEPSSKSGEGRISVGIRCPGGASSGREAFLKRIEDDIARNKRTKHSFDNEKTCATGNNSVNDNEIKPECPAEVPEQFHQCASYQVSQGKPP